MLVENGLVSQDQLDVALAEHKKAGLKLGQYLIRQGVIKEPDVVDLISRQLRLGKYNPEEYPLDVGVFDLVPPDISQKYNLVPVSRMGSRLIVAMTDPLDIDALDHVELIINGEVEPIICTEKELQHLSTAVYGSFSSLGGVMESIEDVSIGAEEEEPGAEDVQVGSLQDMAEEAPVVRLVNSVLSQAVRDRASDIHISPERRGIQIRFRIDGKLHEVPAPPKNMFLPLVARLKILSNMDIATTRLPQDGRFSVSMDKREINVRASTLPTIYGENMVLRLLDMSAGGYTLDELGMGPSDREKTESVIQKPYGMILSTGPTGTGKSTSLYAILRQINKPDINIVTLEDPVEYRVKNVRQVQLNRKAGMTFASGLRAIMRQDPDVIMVGEIRDSETANIAVQAAMTGHRVLSTMHTNDSAGAITRLLEMGIEPYLVSSVVLCSFGQRLVRVVCPYCKQAYEPDPKALAALGIKDAEGLAFMRGEGCNQCSNTGFLGRTGIFEILVITELVQDMILKRSSTHEITRAAVRAGELRTLKEEAAEKAAKGITTVEEAMAAVMT